MGSFSITGLLFDQSQFDAQVQVREMARGYRYEALLTHKGLSKQRSISSTDREFLERKLTAQIRIWDELWIKQVERDQGAQKKEKLRLDKEGKKTLAVKKTDEARKALHNIKNTLTHTLTVNDAIHWDSLKDASEFNRPTPQKTTLPSPVLKKIPEEPLPSDPEYLPKFTFFEKLIPSKKEAKIKASKELFRKDHFHWEEDKKRIESENSRLTQEYQNQLSRLGAEHAAALQKWKEEKQAFLKFQTEANATIDARREQYTLTLQTKSKNDS